MQTIILGEDLSKNGPTINDYLKEGKKCEASGDFAGAIDNYTRALTIADHYSLHYTRGCAYQKMGEPEQAAADFEIFLSADERQAKLGTTPWGASAGILSAAKIGWQRATAQKTLTQVTFRKILKPTNPFDINYSNKTLYDWKLAAIADTPEETLTLKENPQEAAYRMGVKFLLRGKHEEAVRSLNEAIEMKPEDAKPYFFRGIVYILQSRRRGLFGPNRKARELSKAKAKGDCKQALALSKGNVSIEHACARVMAQIFKECPYCGKTLDPEYWGYSSACPYCKKAF